RSQAELAEAPFRELVDPKDHHLIEDIWKGFAQGSFPHMVDLTIRRSTEQRSEKRVLSVSFSSVLREDSGAILVSFRDVTSDRATAAELTKTKEFLERVIESSVDAILSADMNGVVLLLNRAA